MRRFDALGVPLDGTQLVEASAGTGKTYAITNLFVRLVVERELSVDRILVVTFTNAATAELRLRVRRRLREVLDGLALAERGGAPGDASLAELLAAYAAREGGLPRARTLVSAAIHDMDSAAISTIHGFCQSVLLEQAFGSGLRFEQELVADVGPLLRELVEDFWAERFYGASEARVRFLLANHGQLADLLSLARAAAAFRDVRVVPDASVVDPEAALTACFASRERAGTIWQAERDRVRRMLAGSDALNRHMHPVEKTDERVAVLDALFSDARPWLDPRTAEVRRYSTGKLKAKAGTRLPSSPFFGACQELIDAYDTARAGLSGWLIGAKQELVERVRRELPRKKLALGIQSFDDLLYGLRDALQAPGGDALARRIQSLFPAALIDEFQDTDPVQYEIFRRVYSGAGSTLFLIGDPKQAIYAFRGADIAAYLAAAHAAGDAAWTLDTSYRADRGLVRALNCLWSRIDRPFGAAGIAYTSLEARPDAGDELAIEGRRASAIEIVLVPRASRLAKKGSMMAKRRVDPHLPLFVADDIARTLARRSTLGGRAVLPRDFAVLTRTNKQALAVQAALRALAIPSVLHGDASVFDSAEAVEVARVMAAIAEPGNAALLRSALATSLLGVRAEELDALGEDEQAMEAALASIATWHEIWVRRGFVQAFRRMLRDQDVSARVLSLVDGERRMTNVLHLLELLHQASITRHLGIPGLVAWFDEMRHDEKARQGVMAAESAQIRLESDAAAVQVTTMHRSKGLEYPIVYCPWLFETSKLREPDKRVLRYHEPADSGRIRLDLDPSELKKAIADSESHAEALRLAYVALTRARHRVVVFWGAVNGHESSPLGYLLHQGESESAAERLRKGDDAMIARDLDRLVRDSGGSITWRTVDETRGPEYVRAVGPTGELSARAPRRRLDRTWRSSSFSAIHAAEDMPTALPVLDGIDRDALEIVVTPTPVLAAPEVQPVALHAFPRGARPGDLLHRILERHDFMEDEEALQKLVAAELARASLDPGKWAAPVTLALSQVLSTPLVDEDPGLVLCRVARADRVPEMEFVFPVAQHGRAIGPRDLAAAFRRHARPPVPGAYAERVAGLGFQPLSGFMRGFIDLVFQHEGRFWVVDWKSNHLGAQPASYAPDRLLSPMLEHDYFLQYHLYVVALHRHLAARLPGYDYDRNFGGVLYLFLRGVAPEHRAGTGVFRDRPSRELVEALSRALDAPADEVRA